MIGLKDFVGFAAKDLPPSAGALIGGSEQIGRNLAREFAVCFGGEIAHTSNVAGFVFDLNHDDGVVVMIDFIQVMGKSGKGAFIGFEGVVRKRREDIDRIAIGADDAWVFGCVVLNPDRRIMHVAVFPRAEPQENDSQVVGARPGDDGVEIAEIEFAGLRFQLLPINGRGNGVGVQRFHGVPHLRQLAGPCAGVVNLSAQYKKRFAIDKQGVAACF